MINVTKSYLPDRKKFDVYVDRLFDSGWLTNRGELVQELEVKLAEHLGVKNVIAVANGSLALQVCYKALGLRGRVLTTPFSFAATASTLSWEGLVPDFVDVCPKSFNICINKATKAQLESASAIVPVHVFGNPCDVERIQQVAEQYKLKVVYDAAHAFGVEYKGNSLFSYGDLSTVSFHATKLFHSIEGGAIITDNDDLAEQCRKLINFGITGPTSIDGQGTNAKMNEFEAAMGLCVLDEIDIIYEDRARIWRLYTEQLKGVVQFQLWSGHSENRFSYAPILLKSEEQVIKIEKALKHSNVTPRRYFYPSLNTCDYTKEKQSCPVSEDISDRILCLPIYPGLGNADIMKIASIVKEGVLSGD